jgi:O-antigen/teichoic acid export membrane protein
MFIKKHIGGLWQNVTDFFTKGHQRTLEVKKNVLGSLLIKGISIGISLLLVPLSIGYINPAQYGIWLTLSSVISWLSFFDIGFTHGLRNKFAEAKAKGNTDVAKIYVSTTYFYVGIIFFALWLILLFINRFVNWHILLKLPPEMELEVSRLAILILTYFCFQFVFRVINTILIADQQPAKASLLDMLGQLLGLLLILALRKFTSGSLLYLGLVVGAAPLLVAFTANLILFNSKYKVYKPSLKFVRKEYAKNIMQLGVKFFVIQVVGIIQFESSLVIIAHYFGPMAVTYFNIAYKYFFALQMVFIIVISPLWTGVTDAYNTGDIIWIKNAIKKYLYILVPFIFTGLIMLLLASKIYNIWVGEDVAQNIEFYISLLCLVLVITNMFTYIFVFVINGIGALRIQFLAGIISSSCFFLLTLLFIKQFQLGVKSVLIASIITNLYGYVIAPIQVYKILYQKSTAKIWYR